MANSRFAQQEFSLFFQIGFYLLVQFEKMKNFFGGIVVLAILAA